MNNCTLHTLQRCTNGCMCLFCFYLTLYFFILKTSMQHICVRCMNLWLQIACKYRSKSFQSRPTLSTSPFTICKHLKQSGKKVQVKELKQRKQNKRIMFHNTQLMDPFIWWVVSMKNLYNGKSIWFCKCTCNAKINGNWIGMKTDPPHHIRIYLYRQINKCISW